MMVFPEIVGAGNIAAESRDLRIVFRWFRSAEVGTDYYSTAHHDCTDAGEE